MRPTLFWVALVSIAFASAMSPATRTMITTLSPCRTTLSTTASASITSAPTKQAILQPATSAVITIPPNEFELHDPRRKRQECFNDQGFSVDCATWTGYYYTWGPSGNPYEGGPGEGGGGGGSSGEQTTIIAYAGGAGSSRAYSAAGLLLVVAAFLL